MKISYKVLKKYIPSIPSPEKIAEMLIMHTAEVEGIHSQKKDFENIVYGEITDIQSHENADSLKVCQVNVGESEELQIVCGGSNLWVGQWVAVAKIGASVLWHGQGEPVIMKKTAIRGIESFGMICASEEIGLKEEFPARDEKEILDLSAFKVKPGTRLDEVLGKDDSILEIDNKAINHRPDMFSHIGVAREIAAIQWETLDFSYAEKDFSKYQSAGIKNMIPEVVKRYMGIYCSGVQNTETPHYIRDILKSAEVASKWILVDITNYSLYLYGQPTHCFDADKLSGKIHIRYAKPEETFTALNDKTYTLCVSDIVIADDSGVIALGGIIGGKNSAVSSSTKRIVIEAACFDQAIVRKTGKTLGLRTDALNIFEKDILPEMQSRGASLIVTELEKHFPNFKIDFVSDLYPHTTETVRIPLSVAHINTLIGRAYSETQIKSILKTLGIEEERGILTVPFWRKDLKNQADIAEEIARIDGYDKIEATVPRINLGAIVQHTSYKIIRDTRNFLVDRGFYDMYTYSFVSEALMKKLSDTTTHLIDLKNALSEEITHMRSDLIGNLLLSLQENIREYATLNLFEIGKVFEKTWNSVTEHYEISAVMLQNNSIPYYEAQKILSDMLQNIGITSISFTPSGILPSYAQKGRTADIIIRGKKVWIIWEIHPKVTKNFDISGKVWFFSLNMDFLIEASYTITKAKKVSIFQENNFDLSFVVEKETAGKEIHTTIEKTDIKNIQKVELLDIYEDENKLPGKRSLSFRIYTQSQEGTLDDNYKNSLIKDIISRVEKKGGRLR
jgi:phenylalanyl-tRNA synthetase beta chain